MVNDDERSEEAAANKVRRSASEARREPHLNVLNDDERSEEEEANAVRRTPSEARKLKRDYPGVPGILGPEGPLPLWTIPARSRGATTPRDIPGSFGAGTPCGTRDPPEPHLEDPVPAAHRPGGRVHRGEVCPAQELPRAVRGGYPEDPLLEVEPDLVARYTRKLPKDEDLLLPLVDLDEGLEGPAVLW
jgi:hypothetical protein